MSNDKIRFIIQPGTKKQVETTKTISAWMFFSLGNFKPKHDKYSAKVDGFKVQFRRNGPCCYNDQENSNKLCISSFGYFGSKGYGSEDMIDRVLAKNDEATIQKAFTKLALKMSQDRTIPPTVINLFDTDSDAPQEKPPIEPAWFKIQPASTITKTKEVREFDDLYFDVEQVAVPDDEIIEVQVNDLKILICEGLHPAYSRGRVGELKINHFEWFSESPDSNTFTTTAITEMRIAHSNETIEKAFRQLGEKLLERVKNDSSKKRKAPPTNPRVWTMNIVKIDDEKVDSGKRVKRTPPEAKSD